MQVSGTQSMQPPGMASEPTGSQELGKTEFLQLLIAQLQNQDPLEPMSNSEFVAQLAQFSSVEQLVAVNEGINLLGIQQMGMTNSEAASFVGREVEVRSDKLEVRNGDETATAGFKLADDASTVEVHIRDASGAVIRTLELGAQEQGEVSFDWDCRNDDGAMVSPGTFRIDVVAEDTDGNPVSWETRVRGKVDGVNYDSGYPELVIGSIKVSMSDIVGVYPQEEEQL